MLHRRSVVAGLALAPLAGCGIFSTGYRGPQVTRLVVLKSTRKLYALHNDETLRDFDISLGFAPVGHKQIEGDGRTPEGSYLINRRNPQSQFHLSLGISYPNDQDREFAASIGKSPGGDIFIHGEDPDRPRLKGDWTAGCIAVKNREIERLWAMVPLGTQIDIFA